MGNKFDELRAAVSEAKDVMRAADSMADAMVQLLAGRLKNVSGSSLAALKRELRGFNMRTHRWSKR